MPNAARVEELLRPYTEGLPGGVYEALSTYVDVVMRWNARTNLTSIRDAETLVQRQVGESVFASRFLAPGLSVLDFGSGAGFPGIPLALAVPGLRVTLAESQGKKASFLREVVRTLSLDAEVFSGRVEALPAARVFDAVVMRAVDHSAAMLPVAGPRVVPGGSLLRYLSAADRTEMPGWTLQRLEDVPQSEGRLGEWTR